MLESACHRSESTPEKRPQWEVADIFRLYGEDYRREHRPSFEQRKVMFNIENCRTAVMGGHIEQCDTCDYRQPSYNSCGDRHCPKCRMTAKEQWLKDREAELLPTSYFHFVVTLPHDLNPVILWNKEKLLDILFSSVSETLQAFARDPQWRLVGEPGFIAVLHTWDQKLLDHFHLHVLIPAGVLSLDHSRWVPARENFLFRIESVAKGVRNRYVRHLEDLYEKAELIFPGHLAPTGTPQGFARRIRELKGKEWIAYAKAPFAGPRQVLQYLGRYTHRVALSNERIQSIEGGQITFTYRDRQDHNQLKEMTLPAHEFIRRFLLHVLPKGFVKIRYFGFLSHRKKNTCLPLIRALIDPNAQAPQPAEETLQEMMLRLTGIDINVCPRCGLGRLVRVEEIPKGSHPYTYPKGALWDTS